MMSDKKYRKDLHTIFDLVLDITEMNAIYEGTAADMYPQASINTYRGMRGVSLWIEECEGWLECHRLREHDPQNIKTGEAIKMLEEIKEKLKEKADEAAV